MIGLLYPIIRTTNSFKNVLRCFYKVRRKSNLCIIKFDWLIFIYLFTPLSSNVSFLIVKHGCVREELADVVFFIQKKLQQITVQEHLFGEFTLATLTFAPCTSPTDTLPFTFHFTYVSTTTNKPLI